MGRNFIALGLVITMMSCGKDIDQFIPRATLDQPGDIQRLTDRLQTDMAGDIVTTVSCPCSGDKAFKIDEDVVLVVPPDFVDLNTYPCTQGEFTLQVTVCDTKGEILVSGLPTISEGKLLESRIEMDIKVLDGSSPVTLAHGKQLRLLVQDPDPRDRMELFYGEDGEWIQADGDINTWDNVFNSEWWINVGSDTAQEIITGFGYECLSDSLDWINVDVFYEIPKDQRTTVCLTLPEEFTNTNTSVFMVFDNYNSVLEMKGDPEVKQFCEPYGATPIGFNVTFVVLSEMGEDDYRFVSKSASITPNHTEALTPRNTPYEEIRKYLNTL